MKFFIDNCVPESVSRYLEARGHDVVRLRDAMPTDTPDPIVAREAERTNCILVTHDGDFKQIAPRVAHGQRQRFRKLSRVQLDCKPPRAAERMEAAIELIEHECKLCISRPDKRMHIVIATNLIKTLR